MIIDNGPLEITIAMLAATNTHTFTQRDKNKRKGRKEERKTIWTIEYIIETCTLCSSYRMLNQMVVNVLLYGVYFISCVFSMLTRTVRDVWSIRLLTLSIYKSSIVWLVYMYLVSIALAAKCFVLIDAFFLLLADNPLFCLHFFRIEFN